MLSLDHGGSLKRKRRPAGTPDPDAEVVALSPRTLLESDRYLCEICGQGFQRDQNLQMHRRRHKLPWKLVKRNTSGNEARKRVYVCPEPSCLHHDPAHALGDLVGIKKHFRRKHSAHKQWVCGRCGKGYAVQSDYKAHIKICGSRGHSCDCGRVFSRVETFIEHQDICNGRDSRINESSPKQERDVGMLQLLPGDTVRTTAGGSDSGNGIDTKLGLSIGHESTELWKKEIEMAEIELENARRIRERAREELGRALGLREEAIKRMNMALLEITCHECRQRFNVKPVVNSDGNSAAAAAASYVWSVVNEGEGRR